MHNQIEIDQKKNETGDYKTNLGFKEDMSEMKEL